MARSTQSRVADFTHSFEADYLDIDHWPHAWRVESRDLLPAERLLDLFKVFLAELIEQHLSRTTLRRHRNHLFELGGEIIRQLNLHPRLRKRPILRVLKDFLDQEGGPLIYPRVSETEQRALDSTCRKLHRFLARSKPS